MHMVAHKSDGRPMVEMLFEYPLLTPICPCRYNYLLYVPYQLERLIQFGTLLCLDAFLAVLTIMPVRAMFAVSLLVRASLIRQWRRITTRRSAAASSATTTDTTTTANSGSGAAQAKQDAGSTQGGKQAGSQKDSVHMNGKASATGLAESELASSSNKGGAGYVFRRVWGTLPRWRGWRTQPPEQTSKATTSGAATPAGKQTTNKQQQGSKQQRQKQKQAMIHGKSASSSAIPTTPQLASSNEITLVMPESRTTAAPGAQAKASAGKQASADLVLSTTGGGASSTGNSNSNSAAAAPVAGATPPPPLRAVSVGDGTGVAAPQPPLPRLGGSQVSDSCATW
jgi:hypothetical protein